jgi:hypothetical protein
MSDSTEPRPEQLSARERNDLLQIARQRAHVARGLAKQRAAQVLADFETQMATYYEALDDADWEAANQEAREAMKEANARIAARSRELGIPKRFAPRLSEPYWHTGLDYMSKEEKSSLRKAAHAQIEAAQKRAIFQIDQRSVEVQERIRVPGLTSPLAPELLASIPQVTDLMPVLQIKKVLALIGKTDDTPGAEDE